MTQAAHGAVLRYPWHVTILRVNGREYQIDAPGDTPLLWVLRDFCELRGAKYGCGKGLCGACTVIMDVRAGPLLSDPT